MKQTKAALIPAWVQFDPDTPAKEVAYRVRVSSAAGVLGPRKSPLTIQATARFPVLMTASETHLEAVEKAQKTLALEAQGYPGEKSVSLYKMWCRGRTLEEALCSIHSHSFVFDSWDELCERGRGRIENLAIASTRAYAELHLAGNDENGDIIRETVRFGEGRLNYGEPIAHNLPVRFLSGRFVDAIARLARSPAQQSKEQTKTGIATGNETAILAPERETPPLQGRRPTRTNQPHKSSAAGTTTTPDFKRVCAISQGIREREAMTEREIARDRPRPSAACGASP